MVNWRITATTIHCNTTKNEVTLMVFKDGSTKCTGYEQSVKQGKRHKNQTSCDTSTCDILMQYKNKLFSEETGK